MMQGDGWKGDELMEAMEKVVQRAMPKQKPGRSKQDYGTPMGLVRAIKIRLGIAQFDCDLAASNENRKAPKWITEKQNALRMATWKYGDGWNWLNPPYAKIAPWVHRAYNESLLGVRTAVLVPAGVGTEWWSDYVHGKCEVVLVRPRPKFEGAPINPKTGKPDAYPKDVALLLYGLPEGYEIWRWK